MFLRFGGYAQQISYDERYREIRDSLIEQLIKPIKEELDEAVRKRENTKAILKEAEMALLETRVKMHNAGLEMEDAEGENIDREYNRFIRQRPEMASLVEKRKQAWDKREKAEIEYDEAIEELKEQLPEELKRRYIQADESLYQVYRENVEAAEVVYEKRLKRLIEREDQFIKYSTARVDAILEYNDQVRELEKSYSDINIFEYRYSKALVEYTEAKLVKHPVEIHPLREELERVLAEWEKALEDFAEHFSFGGRETKAFKEYEEAKKLVKLPSEVKFLREKYEKTIEAGRWREVRGAYLKALEVGFPDWKYFREEYELAEKTYNEALEQLVKQYPTALRLRGEYIKAEEKWKEAKTEKYKVEDEYYEALYNLVEGSSEARLLRDKYVEAVEEYNQVSEEYDKARAALAKQPPQKEWERIEREWNTALQEESQASYKYSKALYEYIESKEATDERYDKALDEYNKALEGLINESPEIQSLRELLNEAESQGG